MAESTNRQFVVDASFVLAILLPDENVKALDNTLDLYAQGKIGFFSTHILPFEVLNGIRSAVLRKRINKNLATKFLFILKKKFGSQISFALFRP